MGVLDFYFGRVAAAYVRGRLAEPALRAREARLFAAPLEELAPQELARLIELGLEAGLRLHRFKQTMGLARVQRVLGVLKGLQPAEPLDAGSGRGAFLWPLLDTFPGLPVTAIDQLESRVSDMLAVRDGGIPELTARIMDVTRMEYADGAFEVVTMLEVLEHIPAAQAALTEAVRVAGRSVVLSVPSKPDDNPEHIHLFDQRTLRTMFERAGTTRVRFEYVLNHMVVVATIGR